MVLSPSSSRPTSTTVGATAGGGVVVVHGLAARAALGGLCLLGVDEQDGRIVVSDDLFEAKGELKVELLRIGELTWTRDGRR